MTDEKAIIEEWLRRYEAWLHKTNPEFTSLERANRLENYTWSQVAYIAQVLRNRLTHLEERGWSNADCGE